ncbi:response regulator transcription factor [Hahella sp. HN01]|uniref:response regulator transcription factor n=1 Tax=Hahella sp. HN01 TaxID=2847262 RepID=UPI001C1F0000|nr:response regulator transcription factor [Hahella sp. HN01]MBU6952443.1 response regulator transcription factor [Hahella sp. HN01]
MKIGLLEDDQNLADQLLLNLRNSDFQCRHYNTGKDFLFAVTHDSFDLLIMDWQLPDMDGIDILRKVRQQQEWPIPVLFLTQREAEEDIIEALESGADDYMVKPARPGELIARLKALSRRNRTEETDAEEASYGAFSINHKKRTIQLNGEPLTLTDKDFDLTTFLFENKGRLLSRKYLLERVWGVSSDINTRTVDTHMSRLRRKLGIKPENGFRIKTIYQHGYRLEEVE